MFLRCTNPDHEGTRVGYSLLDVSGMAERALEDGRCPMCPEHEITVPLDGLPVCSCCGSTWTLGDGSATCLPGRTTALAS
jgi:hypothetical protein